MLQKHTEPSRTEAQYKGKQKTIENEGGLVRVGGIQKGVGGDLEYQTTRTVTANNHWPQQPRNSIHTFLPTTT